MSLTLRIEFAGEVVERTFAQPKVSIGRDEVNDIVLRETNVSRQHARLQPDLALVEDLDSAHGTWLNGARLTAPAPIAVGDVITVGKATLRVLVLERAAAPDPMTYQSLEPVVSPVPFAPPLEQAATAVRPALALQASETRMVDPATLAPPGSETRMVDPAALAPPGSETRMVDAAALEPTAADRARAARRARAAAPRRWALALVVLVGVLATALAVDVSRSTVRARPPSQLVPNGEPLAQSFGRGDDVAWSVEKSIDFSFTAVAPARLLGVLHFDSAGLSAGEVTVELNAVPVGALPPDVLGSEAHELVLPPTQVRTGEPNLLVIEPAADAGNWRVSNLWLETVPVPALDSKDALDQARARVRQGEALFEHRALDARNLFNAWKQFREGWLLLQASRAAPDAEVRDVAARMRELRVELDTRCAEKLMDYQKEMRAQRPSYRRVRKILKDIPTSFGKEHPCYDMSHHLLRELVEW